jgi:hypothetical protein
VISDLAKTADELNQPQNIVPFSPLNAGEEAVIDAYLRSRRSATITDGIASTLAELGAEPNIDIDLQAIEVGAGLITGKYAGGRSLPNWSIFDIRGGVDYSRALDDRARKNRRLFSIILFCLKSIGPIPGRGFLGRNNIVLLGCRSRKDGSFQVPLIRMTCMVVSTSLSVIFSRIGIKLSKRRGR